MLTLDTIAEIAAVAADKLASVAGKKVPIEKRGGRTIMVPAADVALCPVALEDLKALVDAAKPSGTENELERLAALKGGAAASNPRNDEVTILARDLALLCAMQQTPSKPPKSPSPARPE